jgi:hypothetical protein
MGLKEIWICVLSAHPPGVNNPAMDLLVLERPHGGFLAYLYYYKDANPRGLRSEQSDKAGNSRLVEV